jgi:glucokinase
MPPGAVVAAGIGVPGIVDTRTGTVKVTVNINLSGFDIARALEKKLHCPVAAGNDVDLGILGEQWQGAARGASNVIGLFPGTGVGGGIIVDNKLVRGSTGAAAELGHMIMQIDGPRCSCGNRGCLEALTSRWAIERDIRRAVKQGEKTVLTRLTGNNLSVIKSKVLQQALQKKDKLTIRLLKHAALILGIACINLRHIFDPELILFGGGLIEACGDFLLPLIRKTVERDPFFAPLSTCTIVASSLEDNATILGAVALMREKTGMACVSQQPLPVLAITRGGNIKINGVTCAGDVYIRANGTVKNRGKKAMKNAARIETEEVEKICRKKTDVLIIGTGKNGPLTISSASRAFLKAQNVTVKILPLAQAVRLYNTLDKYKVFLVHSS